MKKPVKILLAVLTLILISVFSFSAYKLYDIIHGYQTAKRSYNDLSSEFVSDSQNSETEEQSSVSAPAAQQSGVTVERSPINVDFPSLMGKYKDIIGWIYCPDTVINYPVVISSDNAYYLNKLADGTPNANGSIFADFRSSRNFSGRNTILYGHHMNDGSMFASIVEYKNQEYLDSHPYMYLNTPDGNYRIEIFSAFITSSTSPTYTLEFVDDETFVSFAARMKALSDSSSLVTVSAGDRIVCLSTCTYEYNDARYVVFGKLVPIQ